MEVSRHVLRFEREGQVYLCERTVEHASLREHPDNDVRLAIKLDGAPDDARVSTEVGLPKRIAEHRHTMLAQLVFIRSERPPPNCANAEDVEAVGGHACSTKLDGVGDSRQRD